MRKRSGISIIYILWAVIAFVMQLGGTARAQELIDRIVAVVEKEPILLSEIKTSAQYLATRFRVDPEREPERYASILRDVLQLQIDEKVLLAKAIEDSIVVTDEEVDQMLDRRISQLVAQYGSEAEVEKQFGFNLKQLKKLYRDEMKNAEMTRRLRQRKIQEVTVTPEEVEEYYTTHKDSLPEIPDQYNISHVLLEVRPGEDVMKRAYERADSLRQRALAGEDFSRLAELYSDDRNSARDGGRLGLLKRGDLGINNFEEVLFTLQPGEISNVIQTPLGFHVVKVTERRGDRVDAQHILISAKAVKEDEQRIIDRLWEIKRRAESGEDFGKLSEQHSEDPEVAENKGNLGWVELDKIAIEPFKKVIPELKPGEISAPFKTSYGYHILRLNAMRPRHQYNLTDDFDEIKEMALQLKGTKQYEHWLDELRRDTFIQIKVSL